MNRHEAIKEELAKLRDPAYRQEQGVWADEKQLRHLMSLLGRVRSSTAWEPVADLSRMIADSAPCGSNLMRLSEGLYDLSS